MFFLKIAFTVQLLSANSVVNWVSCHGISFAKNLRDIPTRNQLYSGAPAEEDEYDHYFRFQSFRENGFQGALSEKLGDYGRVPDELRNSGQFQWANSPDKEWYRRPLSRTSGLGAEDFFSPGTKYAIKYANRKKSKVFRGPLASKGRIFPDEVDFMNGKSYVADLAEKCGNVSCLYARKA